MIWVAVVCASLVLSLGSLIIGLSNAYRIARVLDLLEEVAWEEWKGDNERRGRHAA